MFSQQAAGSTPAVAVVGIVARLAEANDVGSDIISAL